MPALTTRIIAKLVSLLRTPLLDGLPLRDTDVCTQRSAKRVAFNLCFQHLSTLTTVTARGVTESSYPKRRKSVRYPHRTEFRTYPVITPSR